MSLTSWDGEPQGKGGKPVQPVLEMGGGAAHTPADDRKTASTGSRAPTLTVIGLDISLTSTGIASRGWTTRIRSAGKNDATLYQRRARILGVARQVLDYCTHADLVVIEGPSYESKYGHPHDRSGLWWLIVHQLGGVPVVEVAPKCRARYATGKGGDDKAAVMREVARRFPWFDGGDDEADALVLAAMGYDAAGQPLCSMPATHRAALTAVAWPDLGPTAGVA